MEGFDGVNEFAKYGTSRFKEVAAERQIDLTNMGFLDVVLVIDGRTEKRWQNDEAFLDALTVVYPHLSSSYLWRDYRGSEAELRPYPIADTFEQFLIIAPRLWARSYTQFTIFDPKGRFFVRDGLYDDLLNDQPRGQSLEPIVQLLLVGEALVIGSLYAKALGYDPGTQLRFSIGWQGLRGRNLKSRSAFIHEYYPSAECREDAIQLEFTLAIEPSKQEIIRKATEVIRRLARSFRYTFSEPLAQRVINSQIYRETV